MELTKIEIVEFLDVMNSAGSTIGYPLSPNIYEISDNILLLKSLFLDDVKRKIKLEYIGLKSILTTYKTLKSTEKVFYAKLCILNSIQDP